MKRLFLLFFVINSFLLFAQNDNDTIDKNSILLKNLRLNIQANVLQTISLNAQVNNGLIKKTIINKHIYSIGETIYITIRAINNSMAQDTLVLPNSCEVYPVINDMDYLSTFHKGCFEAITVRIIPANDSITWQYEWPDSSMPELALNEGNYSVYGEFGNWNTNSDTIRFVMKKGITLIENDANNVKSIELFQNYPNPFNPVTKIAFRLKNSSYITIKVYDIFGKEVTTILSEKRDEGLHRINWEPKNISSGIYYYKLQTEKYYLVKKLIYLK